MTLENEVISDLATELTIATSLTITILICFTIGCCVVYFCDTWIKVEQIRKQDGGKH